MNKLFTKEYIVATLAVGLLILLHNPFNFWMPNMLEMWLSLLVCVAVIVFGVFLWRETAADEREQLHIFIADRIALLTVAGVLTLAVVVQGINHELDPWIGLALGALIVGKAVGQIYSKRKH